VAADEERESRAALRRRLIAERLAMGEAERRRANAAILRHLSARFPPGRFGVVAGYWPIRGEADPLPYLAEVIAAGGVTALPVTPPTPAPLAFRRWTPGAAMETDSVGVPHPVDGAEVTPEALIVPLAGFDAAGHRLGYGAGYYDRTLAALSPRPYAIGVGFELGRLATIAPEPHDEPLDAIVTEAGLVWPPAPGRLSVAGARARARGRR